MQFVISILVHSHEGAGLLIGAETKITCQMPIRPRFSYSVVKRVMIHGRDLDRWASAIPEITAKFESNPTRALTHLEELGVDIARVAEECSKGQEATTIPSSSDDHASPDETDLDDHDVKTEVESECGVFPGLAAALGDLNELQKSVVSVLSV